jgi:alpha-tubulin suppressor-like RCC1 family protein
MRRLVPTIALVACHAQPGANPPTTLPATSSAAASSSAVTTVTPPAPAGPASAIFAGGGRTCAVLGKEIRCWGEASRGSLGPNVGSSSIMVPTALPGIEGAVEIAFGEQFGCARMPDATVRCWGANDGGALGNKRATGDSPTPAPVPGLTGVAQIAAGGDQVCALASGGAVSCWGGDFGDAPSAIAGLTDAVQLAAGQRHVCARTKPGGVVCWGEDDHLQLGDAKPGPRQAAPRPIAGLAHVDEIAAGGDDTCARTGGSVRCWGSGFDAVLGDPARADSGAPRSIPDLDDAKAIAMGTAHACALRAGGGVACWGGPDYGPFGVPAGCPQNKIGLRTGDNGQEVMRTEYCAAPVAVDGLAGVVSLAHGMNHACALLRGGEIRCWGGENSGELGNRDHGSGGSKFEPIAVTFPAPRAISGTRATAVSISGHWSCALISDGTVRCWGANPFREMPIAEQSSVKPVAVPGLAAVKSLAIGSYHGCVLLDKGAVQCWGYDGEGERGDGTIDGVSSGTPVAPVGLPPITALSAAESQGSSNTCALSATGDVWCWGKKQAAPKQVAGVKGATSIAAGSNQDCAIAGGQVSCWWAPSGEVKPIAGLDHAVQLAVGDTRVCVIRDDQSLWCADTSAGTPAVKIDTKGPLRALAAAAYRGIAVRQDGSVITWWLESPSNLTEVRGLKDPASIAAAADDFAAMDHDGRVFMWGENSMGQLGNPDVGTDGSSEAPGIVSL